MAPAAPARDLHGGRSQGDTRRILNRLVLQHINDIVRLVLYNLDTFAQFTWSKFVLKSACSLFMYVMLIG